MRVSVSEPIMLMVKTRRQSGLKALPRVLCAAMWPGGYLNQKNRRRPWRQTRDSVGSPRIIFEEVR